MKRWKHENCAFASNLLQLISTLQGAVRWLCPHFPKTSRSSHESAQRRWKILREKNGKAIKVTPAVIRPGVDFSSSVMTLERRELSNPTQQCSRKTFSAWFTLLITPFDSILQLHYRSDLLYLHEAIIIARNKFSSSLNDLDDHLIARPLIVGSLTLSVPDQFIISFVASLKARAPINCASIGADSRSVTGKSFVSQTMINDGDCRENGSAAWSALNFLLVRWSLDYFLEIEKFRALNLNSSAKADALQHIQKQ